MVLIIRSVMNERNYLFSSFLCLYISVDFVMAIVAFTTLGKNIGWQMHIFAI